MKVKELLEYLHSIAPPQFQEDYDNSGLITGNYNMNIQGVLVSLDCTEDIIDEAINLGCNVVVSHHPIIFRGLKRLNGSNYIERTVIKAIKNDVAIYAIHTNLDNVFVSGVNSMISEKMGLKNLKILAPKGDLTYRGYSVGAGMVGDLESPMETTAFFDSLKENMELKVIKHTAICKSKVQKVAVCGGSGGFLLNDAKTAEADVFITSDYKYHEFFDADNEIIIVDIGHFESEKYTIDLLYSLIVNKFSNFATHFTKVVTNPVQYY